LKKKIKPKKKANHISSVGIIHRKKAPLQVLGEKKDGGHPIKHARGKLCLIGGNLTDAGDRNTKHTFIREVNEEFSLSNRPIRDANELKSLGIAETGKFEPTSLREGAIILPEDIADLEFVKQAISSSAVPFGDYLITVPKSVLDSDDPSNTRLGFTTLSSYWRVPLNEDVWNCAVRLQKKYGNLSNESETLITSCQKIIEEVFYFAFGHGRAMKDFFSSKRANVKDFPLVPGLTSVHVGMPLSSYEEYLELYEIERHPF
jgi:hypothetical protein